MRLWAIIILGGGVLLGYGLTQSAPAPATRTALADVPATPAARPVQAPMASPGPPAAATAAREPSGIAPHPNRGRPPGRPTPPRRRPRHRRPSEQRKF